MIQENYDLQGKGNRLDQSAQTLQYPYQFKAENSRQQKEVNPKVDLTEEKLLKHAQEGSQLPDVDDLQSNTKESCLTFANSSMEIQPKQLMVQKTKKKKLNRQEELRSQLLEALQQNEQLKERIILLQALWVESKAQLQDLKQRRRARIAKRRKFSF